MDNRKKSVRSSGFETPFSGWQIGFYILFVFNLISFSLFSIISLSDLHAACIFSVSVYMTFSGFTLGNYY
jgi:hypothetical protein